VVDGKNHHAHGKSAHGYAKCNPQVEVGNKVEKSFLVNPPATKTPEF
jgi:hypothetical protein